MSEEKSDLAEAIYEIGEATLATSHHTRSSTSRFHAKSNTQAKKREELAFLTTRLDTSCHLETIDKQTIKK